MKRLTALILATAFLCGCAEGKTEESKAEPATFDAEAYEPVEDIICSMTKFYETEEEFRSSEFCAERKEAGWDILIPEYDHEKYQLESISSDLNYYNYTLYDKESDELVEYSFNLGSNEPDFEYYKENKVYDFQCITTAESGGVIYDVLVHATPYNDTMNHAIEYSPCEGYYCVFWAGSNASMEEVIEAFGNFKLVSVWQH